MYALFAIFFNRVGYTDGVGHIDHPIVDHSLNLIHEVASLLPALYK